MTAGTATKPLAADYRLIRGLVKDSSASLWVADGDRIVVANAGAARLFRAPNATALEGISVSAIFSDGVPAEGTQQRTTARRLDGTVFELELTEVQTAAGLRIFQARPAGGSIEHPERQGELADFLSDAFRDALERADGDCVDLLTLDSSLIHQNRAGSARMLRGNLPSGLDWLSSWEPQHRTALDHAWQRTLVGEVGQTEAGPWSITLHPVRDHLGAIRAVLAQARDNSHLELAKRVEKATYAILGSVADHESLNHALAGICELAELLALGLGHCGILAAHSDHQKLLAIIGQSEWGPRIIEEDGFPVSLAARAEALGRSREAVRTFIFPFRASNKPLEGCVVMWASSPDVREAEVQARLALCINLCTLVVDRTDSCAEPPGSELTAAAGLRGALSGLYLLDSSGRRTFANDAFFSITGISRDNLAGDAWIQAVTVPDRDRVIASWRSAHASQSEFHAECRLGLRTWIMAVEGPFDGGRAGTITVISEWKRVHEALAESEDRFRTLANNIDQLCWIADHAGWVFWYSKRWLDYTGLTIEQMQGLGWRGLFHPGEADRVEAAYLRQVVLGEAWEDVYRLRGQSGEYRWFLARMVPIHEVGGKIRRWFGSATDITELRELEATIQRNNEALRRSNEDLERFAFAAGHDLQEPLRSISNYARRLRGSAFIPARGESAEYLENIIDTAERMTRLIGDLLYYAQVSHGEAEFEAVDLHHATVTVLRDSQAAIQEAGASVKVDPLPKIRASRPHIIQLLSNLINNSIRYRRCGVPPQIHVHAEREGEMWAISVKDNGRGFEPSKADEIFQLFKRLHGRAIAGNGVGLGVCRAIVTRYGGTIRADGRPGEGATFTFTLPGKRRVISRISL